MAAPKTYPWRFPQAVAISSYQGIEMVKSLPKLNWMRLRVRMAFEAVCESDVTSRGMAMVASHRTVTERAFLASLPNDCAWSKSAPEYPPKSEHSVTTCTANL